MSDTGALGAGRGRQGRHQQRESRGTGQPKGAQAATEQKRCGAALYHTCPPSAGLVGRRTASTPARPPHAHVHTHTQQKLNGGPRHPGSAPIPEVPIAHVVQGPVFRGVMCVCVRPHMGACAGAPAADRGWWLRACVPSMSCVLRVPCCVQVSKFDDPQEACLSVVAESYRLWLQHETRTDDITMVRGGGWGVEGHEGTGRGTISGSGGNRRGRGSGNLGWGWVRFVAGVRGWLLCAFLGSVALLLQQHPVVPCRSTLQPLGRLLLWVRPWCAHCDRCDGYTGC